MSLKRVAVMIGFFSSNAVQLAIYNYSDEIEFIVFHTLSLLIVLVALCFLFVDFHLHISMIICDSFLIGMTVGWLTLVFFTGISKYIEFFAINLILSTAMFLVDVIHQCKRKQHENENNGAVLGDDSQLRAENSPFQRKDSGEMGAFGDIESNLNGDCLVRDDWLYKGFRVILDKLPGLNTKVSFNMSWSDFSYIEHRVDSSSCHIYSAYWQQRPVILKLIKADRMQSQQALGEFETEANILSRVRHPNIIKLLGSGQEPRPFLVLELLDGGSLSHSLGLRSDQHTPVEKHAFSYMETLQFALSLASALDYLHNNWIPGVHILHRDLKPDNIGWTADGSLKLFDFGLAVCVRSQEVKSETYELTGNTGTLRYMAPEVALGKQYNQSVDVFSFGIIVWQVLTGKVPFSTMGKKTFVDQVVLGGLRPKLEPSWPAKFNSLLEKCWHEEKDQRPGFSHIVSEIDRLMKAAQQEQTAGLKGCFNRLQKVLWRLCELVVYFRPLVFIASICMISFGAHVLRTVGLTHKGLVLVVVSSILLYLVGMSYVRKIPRRRLPVIRFVGLGLDRGLRRSTSVIDASFNPISLSSIHGMKDYEATMEGVQRERAMSRAAKKSSAVGTGAGAGGGGARRRGSEAVELVRLTESGSAAGGSRPILTSSTRDLSRDLVSSGGGGTPPRDYPSILGSRSRSWGLSPPRPAPVSASASASASMAGPGYHSPEDSTHISQTSMSMSMEMDVHELLKHQEKELEREFEKLSSGGKERHDSLSSISRDSDR